MANKGNVTVGKPLVAGAVYRAPVGTTLPTAADATLDEAFAPVGYISDDGLRWSYSGDGDVIRAWGRDVVSRPAGAVDDVASFQMLETVDEEAVKAFWGDDARQIITGGYALQVGVPSPVQYSWVIDMLLPDQRPKAFYHHSGVRRIVIPAASVRDREEIVYQDSELVAYGVSLKAAKDSAGNYHYEYVTPAEWVEIVEIPAETTMADATVGTANSFFVKLRCNLFSQKYILLRNHRTGMMPFSYGSGTFNNQNQRPEIVSMFPTLYAHQIYGVAAGDTLDLLLANNLAGTGTVREFGYIRVEASE